MPSDLNDRAAEFDVLMARAGLRLSDELRAQVLPAYAGLCEQTALLRAERPAASEPSNTFRLHRLAGA